MTNIRTIDMPLLDDLFEMGGGWVLNFTDRTFAQFFAEELNIDIYDSMYSKNGTSKGKRLKCFLQTVDKTSVVKTLLALWEYRETLRQRAGKTDEVQNAQGQLLALIAFCSGVSSLAGAGLAAGVPGSAAASGVVVAASLLVGVASLAAGLDGRFA